MTIIAKFGGTSLGNAERIKNTAKIISEIKKKKDVVVVVSAIGKITDFLINAVKNTNKINIDKFIDEVYLRHFNILKEIKQPTNQDKKRLNLSCNSIKQRLILAKQQNKINPEDIDYIAGFGEKFSAFILSIALEQLNFKTKMLCGDDNLIFTNNNFNNAEVLFDKTNNALEKKILPIIKENIIVFTGFVGTTLNNKTTCLGRGSSDYIASIIGASLDAKEIRIYTDVDGIMTADPRIVKNAKIIKKLDFNEMSELACFGAYVLHPKTIEPAMKKNICVKVINSNNTKKFTEIFNKREKTSKQIKAISSKTNISILNIYSTRMLKSYGFLAKVFKIFEEEELSVDLICTSEVNISLSLNGLENNQKMQNIINKLNEFSFAKLKKNKALICIVGEFLKHKYGSAGNIFNKLGENKINIEMISQGASEISISFIVENADAKKAVLLLHKELIESN
ncbi:MAG: hypothetical protein B6U87_01830 [Candidatus Aenigmarchaeota archaeon ex4484_52]|nr:MAG: hypothetical protein B6U87_01830 [Candidatus Aenigmarchaeota archaeon ex4484_52]